MCKYITSKFRCFASEALGAIIGKFDELIGGLTSLRTAANAWCFVAGTLIAAANGMVPIEQIQQGDLVFSADEQSGVITLQPVIQLYRHQHDSSDLWQIAYDHDNNSTTPEAKITCTSEHPFWSETRSEFIPAAELRPGEDLRSVLSESMRVVSVVPVRGPPDEDQDATTTTTVYNFAVANNHSYLAGDGGVWVHNTCAAILDDYRTFRRTVFYSQGAGNAPTPTQWANAFVHIEQKLDADLASGRINIDEARDVVVDLLTDPPPTIPDRGALHVMQEGVWESAETGLRYGPDATFGNRVKHVLRHAVDDPARSGPHGVFDAGPSEALAVVDEAWVLRGADPTSIVHHAQKVQGQNVFDEYLIDMGRRIEFEGGQAGAAKGNPGLNYLLIVIKNDDEVITAFSKVYP